MNSGELLKGKNQGVDHALSPPESQLEIATRKVGDDMDLYVLADGNPGHRYRGVVKVDTAIDVHSSCLTKAEDVTIRVYIGCLLMLAFVNSCLLSRAIRLALLEHLPGTEGAKIRR